MRRGLKQCLRCMRQLPVLQIFLGLCIGLWLTILDPAAPAAMRCFHVPVRKHRRTVRDSHGVVYVLGLHSPIIEVYRKRYNGRGPYLDELLGSLRTLRQNSPRTPVALVTDAEDNINASVAAMFDQVIVQEGKVHVSWGDVIPAVLASPWRRSLFLDLDVKVCKGHELPVVCHVWRRAGGSIQSSKDTASVFANRPLRPPSVMLQQPQMPQLFDAVQAHPVKYCRVQV